MQISVIHARQDRVLHEAVQLKPEFGFFKKMRKIKSNHKSKHLLVFTRYPEPGSTKTRMIPLLGSKGAAKLHRQMTEHLMEQIKDLPVSHDLLIEILFEGGDTSRFKKWLGKNYQYTAQCKGGIGIRMAQAFKASFEQGAFSTIIIGSDIPGITADLIKDAFLCLAGKNLVLGPAKDGGYYLIGLQKDAMSDAVFHLFSSISWSTGAVLEQTIKKAEKLGLSYYLIQELEDVDKPEDIHVWEKVIKKEKNFIDL